MEDSDKENIETETLEHQYTVTKKETNTSMVSQFGETTTEVGQPLVTRTPTWSHSSTIEKHQHGLTVGSFSSVRQKPCPLRSVRQPLEWSYSSLRYTNPSVVPHSKH